MTAPPWTANGPVVSVTSWLLHRADWFGRMSLLQKLVLPSAALAALLTLAFAWSGCWFGAAWCAVSTYVTVQVLRHLGGGS